MRNRLPSLSAGAALAGLILAESVRRERLRDDCGVQVLYCPEGKTEAREV